MALSSVDTSTFILQLFINASLRTRQLREFSFFELDSVKPPIVITLIPQNMRYGERISKNQKFILTNFNSLLSRIIALLERPSFSPMLWDISSLDPSDV